VKAVRCNILTTGPRSSLNTFVLSLYILLVKMDSKSGHTIHGQADVFNSHMFKQTHVGMRVIHMLLLFHKCLI